MLASNEMNIEFDHTPKFCHKKVRFERDPVLPGKRGII